MWFNCGDIASDACVSALSLTDKLPGTSRVHSISFRQFKSQFDETSRHLDNTKYLTLLFITISKTMLTICGKDMTLHYISKLKLPP